MFLRRRPLSRRAVLDDFVLQLDRDMHDALDENAWRMDMVRVDLARLHQMLDFRDRELGGGRHDRVEIAGRLPVDEIALGVALPGVDNGDVGEKAALHQVSLAVELARLLALGDDRADAGPGEKGGNAGAAGADALGERALRIEFELQLAGEILLREQLVLADIGRDHLPDLPGIEQKPEAAAVDAG